MSKLHKGVIARRRAELEAPTIRRASRRILVSAGAQEDMERKGFHSRIHLAAAGKVVLVALKGKVRKSLSMKADGVSGTGRNPTTKACPRQDT